MPTFLPRIPATFAISFSVPSMARRPFNDGYWLGSPCGAGSLTRPGRRPGPHNLFMFLAECLDLDVNACRQIEFHQRIHRLLRRLENIEQALGGAGLKPCPGNPIP